MKHFSRYLVLVLLAVFVAVPVFAMSPDELSAETVAYLQTTKQTTPTMPETVMAKVDDACALLQAEGEAAFPKFKGNGSEFLYSGTYIWIHTLKDGKMLMHPIKHKMEGKTLINLKDKKGKRFFVTMNNLVIDKGAGWVGYWWPVPGTKDIVQKVSYVKKCTMADGTEVVIGSGIYNADPAAMAQLEIN